MPKGIGYELQGVQQTLRALQHFKHATATKAERGLRKAGLYLLRMCLQIVPVDTGALKNSGRMNTTGNGFDTIVWIEFLQSYAIYVHENLEAHHKPPTQAKFVEAPMRMYRAEILKIIETELRKKS